MVIVALLFFGSSRYSVTLSVYTMSLMGMSGSYSRICVFTSRSYSSAPNCSAMDASDIVYLTLGLDADSMTSSASLYSDSSCPTV